MSLEAATYINSLVVTNPLSTDPRSDGDDHLRLLKSVLKSTFPNIAGAIIPTETEINYLDGVTSAIQTQLDSKASMPAGTVCLFYQAAAPTGWTQITTQNNKALRVVSGTGEGTGGSVAFTSAFASQSVVGSVASHVLTIAEIPNHVHGVPLLSWNWHAGSPGNDTPQYDANGSTLTGGVSGSTGGGHSHGFTGTAINLAVQYIDMILASRN